MNLSGKTPLGLKERKPKKDAKAKRHMMMVKMLPCVICGKPPPSDAHHVICDRYSQSKASDYETIPLCKDHHQWGDDAIHNGKESWVARYGKDYDYLPRVRKMLGLK